MSAAEAQLSSRGWIRRTLFTIVALNALALLLYVFLVPPLFKELEGHRKRVNCSAISNDGMFLATGTNAGVVRIWTGDGQLLQQITGHSGSIRCMSFSASLNRLATGCGKGEIRVWSATEGIETLKLQHNSEAVHDLAFSDDGQSVYSVGQDKSIFVWDVHQRKLVTAIPLPSVGTTCVLQSGQQKLLIGCEDGVIRLCDLATKQVVDLLKGHSGSITGLAVTADFEKAATSSLDHTVRLWDVGRGDQLSEFRSKAVPEDVVFCDEGRYLLAGFQGGYLHVFDAIAGERAKKSATPLKKIDSLSSNGADLCLASGSKARAVLFSFRKLIAR